MTQVLRELAAASVPLGIVTNYLERLGCVAAACVGVDFATIVTAGRAGFYKPDPHPYRLGLKELAVEPDRCLCVAGSLYDCFGMAKVGLPIYWHNRSGLAAPENTPAPLAEVTTLYRIPAIVGSQ